MRAVRLHELGGPQCLRLDELPMPQPAAGEALVRVGAAAFNRRDVFITQGLYPGIALPKTLGSDGAGVLEALGSDSACSARAGDAVVIDPMLDWGGDARVWDAKRSSILGMPRDGTFAQYVAVPAGMCIRSRRACPLEEAAAIPLAGLTAYRALFTRGACARRNGAHHRHRRRRADVRAALRQARRRAHDRRRRAATRNSSAPRRSAPT